MTSVRLAKYEDMALAADIMVTSGLKRAAYKYCGWYNKGADDIRPFAMLIGLLPER